MNLTSLLVSLIFGFSLSINAMELEKKPKHKKEKSEEKLLKKKEKLEKKLLKGKSKVLSDGRPHSKSYMVTTYLIVGKFPRVSTVKSYLDAGITYFLDLSEGGEKVPYIDLFNEVAAKQGKAFEHAHMPINDNALPTTAQVNDILNAIDNAISHGHRVYMHHNEANSAIIETIISCYLVRHNTVTGTQAIGTVAQLEQSIGKKNIDNDSHLTKRQDRLDFFSSYRETLSEEHISLKNAESQLRLKNEKREAALFPHDESYMVETGIFAGNYPNKKDIQQYLDAGITFILDLTEEGEHNLESYSQYFKEVAANQGKVLEYVRKPIKDHTVPALDVVKDILNTINDALKGNHKIYIHCHAGIGRTGTIVACYLMNYGMSVDEAISYLEQLRNTRPSIKYNLTLNKEHKQKIR